MTTLADMGLSDRLEELRERRGVSARELARQVGETYSSVDRWLKGTHAPRVDQALKLAEFFGVSLDYLAGRETSTASPESVLSEEERTVLAVFRALRLSRDDAIRRLYGPPKEYADPDEGRAKLAEERPDRTGDGPSRRSSG